MFPSLTIFYDNHTNLEELDQVIRGLSEVYRFSVKKTKKRKLPKSSYNKKRFQYDGQEILNRLIDKENLRFFLWIVNEDLYVSPMNFVFGLASEFYGAIISFYRLENLEMKIKETVHELGHVFGLSHCQNFCVMQYSITLEEALEKPRSLCSTCASKLDTNEKKFERNKD